jgi:phosphatidylglycerol:prolipoprotein diacylglycerol transferase
MDDLIVWCALGIVLGGRIGYELFYNLSSYLAHPVEIFTLWHGGMSFHGGFLGTMLALFLFARSRGLNVLALFDVAAVVTPIGLFTGRLANFVNGELWGRPAPDLPWAIVFPTGGPIPRHPSQLYEASLEGLALLAFLYVLIRLGALKRPGLIIGAFAVFYACARSFSEFFREPDAQLGFLWGGATMGQLLSIPLFLAGLCFIVYALKHPARPKA